jgi:hypothetical protein
MTEKYIQLKEQLAAKDEKIALIRAENHASEIYDSVTGAAEGFRTNYNANKDDDHEVTFGQTMALEKKAQKMVEESLRQQLEHERRNAEAKMIELTSELEYLKQNNMRQLHYSEDVAEKKLQEACDKLEFNFNMERVEHKHQLTAAIVNSEATVAGKTKQLEAHVLASSEKLEAAQQAAANSAAKTAATIHQMRINAADQLETVLLEQAGHQGKLLRVVQLQQSLAIRELKNDLDKLGVACTLPVQEDHNKVFEDEQDQTWWDMFCARAKHEQEGRRKVMLRGVKRAIDVVEDKLNRATTKAATATATAAGSPREPQLRSTLHI